MLLLAAALSASTACRLVERQCRACVVRDGRRRCSTPGIACQPTRRVCAKPEPAARPRR